MKKRGGINNKYANAPNIASTHLVAALGGPVTGWMAAARRLKIVQGGRHPSPWVFCCLCLGLLQSMSLAREGLDGPGMSWEGHLACESIPCPSQISQAACLKRFSAWTGRDGREDEGPNPLAQLRCTALPTRRRCRPGELGVNGWGLKGPGAWKRLEREGGRRAACELRGSSGCAGGAEMVGGVHLHLSPSADGQAWSWTSLPALMQEHPGRTATGPMAGLLPSSSFPVWAESLA